MSNVEVSRLRTRTGGEIRRHGPNAFAGMRKAGRLAAEALDMITPFVQPGVTTEELDVRVLEFALDHNAVPAPLNYRGFPKAICTSINHVVCHGIPGPKPLREGDIINIDVTLIVDGWHGDTSRMYPVGAISRRAERLIEVTYVRSAEGRRGCEARAVDRPHRCSDPGLCREPALQRRARLLRPRARTGIPRSPQHPPLRRGGRGQRLCTPACCSRSSP